MDSIAIVIQHSGQWDENRINYINFEVCGLLIPNSCTYNNLVGIICEQLKLQPESTVLKIEYQVREGYPTFKIVDDSQLMFYLNLKKKETDFTKYPLCLTTEINSIRQSFFSNRSTTTHDQLHDGVAQAEGEASNSDDELVLDCGAEEVVGYIDYAKSVSNQIIEMLDKRNDEEEVIGIDEDLVINKKHHQEICLSQIYQDKDTLKTVLSNYAINNHF